MNPITDPAFWNQPIDVILYLILVWFGWVPLAFTTAWGFIQTWKGYRQGQFNGTLKFVLLAIDAPSMTEQTPKSMENLFSSLAGAYSNLTWKEIWIIGKFQPAFSFEIVSTNGYIQFYVRTQTKYRDGVEAGIYAHYPDAEINEVEDYAAAVPTHYPNDTHDMWGAELTLKRDQYFPIRTYADFEDKATHEIHDPLGPILEQMSKMRPGENYWMQFVCQTIKDDWKEPGIKFINKIYGNEKAPHEGMLSSGMRSLLSIPSGVMEKTLGVNLSDLLIGAAPGGKEADQWKAFKLTPSDIEQTKAVLNKIGKPGFNVKTRIVYSARKEVYNKGGRILLIKGMLNQFNHLNLNTFGFSPLTIPKDDYFWQKWSYAEKQTKLMTGYKNRSMGIGANPKVLNSEELATLWHLPALTVRAPLVKKSEAKRGEPPVGLPIGLDEVSLPSGPPAGYVAGHDAQGHSHGAPAGSKGEAPSHGHEHASVDVHIPESMDIPHPALPSGVARPNPTGEPGAHAPHAEHASIAHVPHGEHPPAYKEEENGEPELGLDATDMGPPADVILPHPPAGYAPHEVEDRDGDGAHEGAPPGNLPV